MQFLSLENLVVCNLSWFDYYFLFPSCVKIEVFVLTVHEISVGMWMFSFRLNNSCVTQICYEKHLMVLKLQKKISLHLVNLDNVELVFKAASTKPSENLGILL